MTVDFIMIYFITISVRRFLKIVVLNNIKSKSKLVTTLKICAVLMCFLIFVTSICYNIIPYIVRLLYEYNYIQFTFDENTLSSTIGYEL